jgi:uncharacterized membrane protein YdfJ with MMPL/SSD domain
MGSWTRLMIRFRWPVVGVWLLVLGNFAGFGLLPSRLSNEFTRRWRGSCA